MQGRGTKQGRKKLKMEKRVTREYLGPKTESWESLGNTLERIFFLNYAARVITTVAVIELC